MKKIGFLIVSVVLSFSFQKNPKPTDSIAIGTKEITLEKIWNGSFRTEGMSALNSMKGDFYAVLNFDAQTHITTVDKYSYKSAEKVSTIVSSNEVYELDGFSSYVFNNDETKLILGTDSESIYRYSSKGTYYVYDIISKKLTLIGTSIQEPTFSPDSKKVMFAKNNNLFILDVATNIKTKVTEDGKFNEIINGTTDWVYEEEFAVVKVFEWNKNSDYVAYLRFDETNVPEFSIDMVSNSLYSSEQVFKYPKAGRQNAKVTLHIYDVNNKTKRKVSLGAYEYIPRLKWSNKADELIVTTLNRHQNILKLNTVNAKTLATNVLLNESDAAYIDINDHLTFLEDNSFIWTSEKDGYNHIYHYNSSGELINQVTNGNWDVTKYYGFNKKNNTIYYQSVENGSINRGVYSIRLNGKKKKLLSKAVGTNQASFSKNFNYFINTHSTVKSPPVYSLYTSDGQKLKELIDNAVLKEKVSEYKMSTKEFSTIHINGNDLNMWLLKPVDFDENKKYPLLMYQYSGPGSQQVANKWNSYNDYWHNMLVQKGIIVVCVDGRGTGLKGRDFKKVTQKELGKYEVEDQIAIAKKLASRNYIDENNIGIWGWSYGGFMSTNCILKGNDIFTTAIAVAPVTSWRFYDTIYTERYMTTPEENPRGYDYNSPINYADKLKGKYLLIHGTGDDNVHVQNTYIMANALVAANKQFDLFVYPDRTHGIYEGRNTRLHLYTKMTNFIEESLHVK